MIIPAAIRSRCSHANFARLRNISLLFHNHRRLATTLVLAEPGEPIAAATCQAVTAAVQLGNDKITLLSVSGAAAPGQVPTGATKLIHVVGATATPAMPETVAAAVQAAVQADSDITHVVGTSTKFGATVIPRIAALLNVSPVTDVVRIESSDVFVRPMYAGNVLAKIQMTDRLKVLSVRPTAFEKAILQDAVAAGVPTESMTVEAFAGTEFVSEKVSSGVDRPDLGSAATVVSGGRGMGTGEQFVLLEKLADALGGGAVGASRAAVDAGMVPNDWQVGQTGKVVAPTLYVAVGISGAIQHLSGMKDSKTIVAINKDPDAPIFQVADYGLVADLFVAVPEMTEKLNSGA